MAKVRLLSLGLSDSVESQIMAPFKDVESQKCPDKNALMELSQPNNHSAPFHIILYGEEFIGLPSIEVAQTIRMLYRDSVILSVSTQKESFDRKALVKNGFTDAFLLPLDQEVLRQALGKYLNDAEAKIYSPVRLVDIGAGTRLDFEIRVFLALNNKYVPYSAVGDVLNEERLERLKVHRMNSVYVPVHQLPKFYEYSAKRLMDLTGESNVMTETERREKLKTSVRELTTGMLSESYSKSLKSGQYVVEHTRHIIDQFLILKHPGDWQQRLLSALGEKGDAYSHSGSVANYAVLFSLALGQGDTREIAMASMFHDLGLAELPTAVQTKPVEDMSPQEFEIYKTHTELSVKVMQSRHITASDAVIQAVEFHHERYGGGGFPHGYSGKRLSVETQILALADRFDELTRIESSAIPLSPDQALRQIEKEAIVQPDFISVLANVFRDLKNV